MLRYILNIARLIAAWISPGCVEVEVCGSPRSRHWPKVRAAHLKKQPACIITGDTKDIEVHHALPYHIFPELELEPSNLYTVRRDMHHLIGHGLDWRAWNPNFIADASRIAGLIKNRKYTN